MNFLPVLETRNFRSNVGMVESPEASLVGLQMAVFSLSSQGLSFVRVCVPDLLF